MTKEELAHQLDGIVAKNPKSDWSKYQRNIINKAIEMLKQDSSEDCVSRQAVDKLCHQYLRQNTDEHIAFYEHFRDLPSVVPQESRWISTGKRLPTREEYIAGNGFFIVSDGNRVYIEHFDIYDSMNFGKPTMNGFKVDTCVTAWMPMPKTYEMSLSKLYLPKPHEEDQKDEDDNREVKE